MASGYIPCLIIKDGEKEYRIGLTWAQYVSGYQLHISSDLGDEVLESPSLKVMVPTDMGEIGLINPLLRKMSLDTLRAVCFKRHDPSSLKVLNKILQPEELEKRYMYFGWD